MPLFRAVASVQTETELHKAVKLAVTLEGEQGVPQTECVVCMAAFVSTILLPCGHLCLCNGCARMMKDASKEVVCPLCRVPVATMNRAYLPLDGQPVYLDHLPPPTAPEPTLCARPVDAGCQACAPDDAGTAVTAVTSLVDAECQVSPTLTRARSPRWDRAPSARTLRGTTPRGLKRVAPLSPAPSPSHSTHHMPAAVGTGPLSHTLSPRPTTALERRPGGPLEDVASTERRRPATARATRAEGADGGPFDFVLPGGWQPAREVQAARRGSEE